MGKDDLVEEAQLQQAEAANRKAAMADDALACASARKLHKSSARQPRGRPSQGRGFALAFAVRGRQPSARIACPRFLHDEADLCHWARWDFETGVGLGATWWRAA